VVLGSPSLATVVLAARSVIHCGAGGQAAWQRTVFDRAAGQQGEGERWSGT